MKIVSRKKTKAKISVNDILSDERYRINLEKEVREYEDRIKKENQNRKNLNQ